MIWGIKNGEENLFLWIKEFILEKMNFKLERYAHDTAHEILKDIKEKGIQLDRFAIDEKVMPKLNAIIKETFERVAKTTISKK